MTKDIEVEIYGQLYSICGELDPSYVARLARAVDSKMRALAQQTDIVDTRRLAVLAALNLVDELEQFKEKFQQEGRGFSPDFLNRLEQCNRLLETALSERPAA